VLAATHPGAAAGPQQEQADAENRLLGGTVRGLSEMVRTGWESPATRAVFVELLASDADEVQRRVLMHFLGVLGDGPLTQPIETVLPDELQRFRPTQHRVARPADARIGESQAR
jgi:hypothetical protein